MRFNLLGRLLHALDSLNGLCANKCIARIGVHKNGNIAINIGIFRCIEHNAVCTVLDNDGVSVLVVAECIRINALACCGAFIIGVETVELVGSTCILVQRNQILQTVGDIPSFIPIARDLSNISLIPRFAVQRPIGSRNIQYQFVSIVGRIINGDEEFVCSGVLGDTDSLAVQTIANDILVRLLIGSIQFGRLLALGSTGSKSDVGRVFGRLNYSIGCAVRNRNRTRFIKALNVGRVAVQETDRTCTGDRTIVRAVDEVHCSVDIEARTGTNEHTGAGAGVLKIDIHCDIFEVIGCRIAIVRVDCIDHHKAKVIAVGLGQFGCAGKGEIFEVRAVARAPVSAGEQTGSQLPHRHMDILESGMSGKSSNIKESSKFSGSAGAGEFLVAAIVYTGKFRDLITGGNRNICSLLEAIGCAIELIDGLELLGCCNQERIFRRTGAAVKERNDFIFVIFELLCRIACGDKVGACALSGTVGGIEFYKCAAGDGDLGSALCAVLVIARIRTELL